MRLTANVALRDYGPFVCWHAEHCCEVHNVTWVDDETSEYEQYVLPHVVIGNDLLRVVHQAKKIVIDTSNRLVIINPVADAREIESESGQELIA